MGDSWLYFDEYGEAIKCYETVVEKYPSEKMACYAQYLTGNCYEGMLRYGKIEKEEGLALIKDSYQKVLDNYPDSKASSAAESRLANVDRRFEYLLLLEGEK